MKKIKPEEYFNNGLFEMARFGNLVETVNHMTPEIHSKYMDEMSNRCDEIKNDIDTLIIKIRELICKAEPTNLIQEMMKLLIT